MGGSNNDHSWVRRHGAQDLRWPYRRLALRAQRRAGHRATRSGHRLQLQHVLQPHSGQISPYIFPYGGKAKGPRKRK